MESRLRGFGIKFIIFFFLAYSLQLTAYSLFAQGTKEPNVAGAFYPDDPQELSSVIDGFLAQASPQPVGGEIFSLIVPHAGYGYSGQTAAFAYKLIKDKPYKTVVVIGTSHYHSFAGVSVYPSGKFRTPLGELEVDSDFAKRLISQNEDSDIGFESQAFSQEHSVEVQLPFLQKTLTDFKIVPIVIGDIPLVTCQNLAALLRIAIGKRQDVLIVVSTDMYHGPDYAEAEKMDSFTLSLMKKMDAETLYYDLRELKVQLCGSFGVVTALTLAQESGHKNLAVLKYTNSAEVTGKKVKGNYTVGYASCAIYVNERAEK